MRVALSWLEEDHLRLADVREDTATKIGRDPGSQIALEDNTVSRNQARINGEGGAFLIENLSTSNLTKVNAVPAERPVTLSDGDVVQMGLVRLTFHDLAAAELTYRPVICSTCFRENMETDSDCWYDGTSLVNAPTIIAQKRPLTCRVVSAAGDSYDLYLSEVFVIRAGGECEILRVEGLPADAAAAIELKDDKPVLLLPSPKVPVSLNGEPASDGQELKTGDELRIGEGHFILAARLD